MADDKKRNAGADLEKRLILTEFTSMVAHKLKNPLAGMMLAATRLRKALEKTDKEQKALSIAARLCESIDAFSDTVDEVAGAVEPPHVEPAPVDINEILLRVLSLISGDAQTADVTVSRELATDLPEVMADAGMAEVALSLLALDAIEAAGSPGALEITSRPTGDGRSVQVVIADSRRDADIDVVESRAHSPFSGGATAPRDLRLCLARRIAELHGGSFTVGAKQDSGIETTISFPVASAMAEKGDVRGQ